MRAGLEGHLPARLRRGRPAAGRLPPARDRPGHRRRAALDHPVRPGRPRTGPARHPGRPRAGRSRAARDRRTPPQPPPRTRPAAQPARRIPRHDQPARHARHDRLVDPLLRAVVPALAVLREDPGGRLQRLRHLQPHVPAGLLRRPDRGVLGAAQRRDRVGRVGRADRRDHRAGRVGVHQHADLPRPDQVRGRAGQVHARHRRGRRHRQRPGPPARSRRTAGGWPWPTRTRACGRAAWRPTPGWTSRSASPRSTRSRSRARSRRTSCGRCSARPSTTSSTTGR